MSYTESCPGKACLIHWRYYQKDRQAQSDPTSVIAILILVLLAVFMVPIIGLDLLIRSLPS